MVVATKQECCCASRPRRVLVACTKRGSITFLAIFFGFLLNTSWSTAWIPGKNLRCQGIGHLIDYIPAEGSCPRITRAFTAWHSANDSLFNRTQRSAYIDRTNSNRQISELFSIPPRI